MPVEVVTAVIVAAGFVYLAAVTLSPACGLPQIRPQWRHGLGLLLLSAAFWQSGPGSPLPWVALGGWSGFLLSTLVPARLGDAEFRTLPRARPAGRAARWILQALLGSAAVALAARSATSPPAADWMIPAGLALSVAADLAKDLDVFGRRRALGLFEKGAAVEEGVVEWRQLARFAWWPPRDGVDVLRLWGPRETVEMEIRRSGEVDAILLRHGLAPYAAAERLREP